MPLTLRKRVIAVAPWPSWCRAAVECRGLSAKQESYFVRQLRKEENGGVAGTGPQATVAALQARRMPAVEFPA